MHHSLFRRVNSFAIVQLSILLSKEDLGHNLGELNSSSNYFTLAFGSKHDTNVNLHRVDLNLRQLVTEVQDLLYYFPCFNIGCSLRVVDSSPPKNLNQTKLRSLMSLDHFDMFSFGWNMILQVLAPSTKVTCASFCALICFLESFTELLNSCVTYPRSLRRVKLR